MAPITPLYRMAPITPRLAETCLLPQRLGDQTLKRRRFGFKGLLQSFEKKAGSSLFLTDFSGNKINVTCCDVPDITVLKYLLPA